MATPLQEAIRNIEAASRSMADAADDLRRVPEGGDGGGGGDTGGGGGAPPPRRRGKIRRTLSEGAGRSVRDLRLKSKLHIDSYAEDIERLLKVDALYAKMSGKHWGDSGNAIGKVFDEMSLKMRKYTLDAPAMMESAMQLPFAMRTINMDLAKGGKESTENLIKTVGFFEELGIKAGDTMEVLDTTTISFGASSNEAAALAISVRNMGEELGKVPEDLIKDYTFLQQNMSYSLGKINSEFRKLEIQSRATGIPVQELVGAFGDQLDTFEGSAESAGKLNAILGGSYINSLELLNATESERVDMVKQAMKAAGTNLRDLEKGKGFGLKAIASSLNLTKDQTRRLLSGRSEQVMKDLQTKGIKGPSLETAELENTMHDLGRDVQGLHGPYNEMILQVRGLKDQLIKNTKDVSGFQIAKDKGLLGTYIKAIEQQFGRADAADKELERTRGRTEEGLFQGLVEVSKILKSGLPEAAKLVQFNAFVKQWEISAKALEELKFPTVIAEPIAAGKTLRVNPVTATAAATTAAGRFAPPATTLTGPISPGVYSMTVKFPNGKKVEQLTLEILKAGKKK